MILFPNLHSFFPPPPPLWLLSSHGHEFHTYLLKIVSHLPLIQCSGLTPEFGIQTCLPTSQAWWGYQYAQSKIKIKIKKEQCHPGRRMTSKCCQNSEVWWVPAPTLFPCFLKWVRKGSTGPEPYAAAEGPTINKARFWKRRPSYETRYEKITLSLPRSFNSGSKK